MKKVILLTAIILVGINACCLGQDVNVNIVYGDYGEYYINGISSAQDIGGVEADFYNNEAFQPHYLMLRLKNYNNCMVTVLCVVRYRIGDYHSGGLGPGSYSYEYFDKKFNVVLDAKETKEFKLHKYGVMDETDSETIVGMIVRRVAE